MRRLLFSCWLSLLVMFVSGVLFVPWAEAATGVCAQAGELKSCSYVTTNGNCKVEIDRMNPVTPPPIYVRRGCAVTVTVSQRSPFEKLTLDWKSSATLVPPDTFQTAFSALSGTLGKVTVVGSVVRQARAVECEKSALGCGDARGISEGQRRVLETIGKFDPSQEASAGLKGIQDALQPPPVGMAPYPQPWGDPKAWQRAVAAELQGPIDTATTIQEQIDRLEDEVKAFRTANAGPLDQLMATTLETNQTALHAGYGSFSGVVAKLVVLQEAVRHLDDGGKDIAGKATISDAPVDRAFYQTQTWMVNSTNILADAAKKVSADPMKSDGSALLSSLGSSPTKVQVTTITVQFQNPSRVEVSTGLMVPLMPYHSYAKASVATNGVVSDNVVQETKTYAVVPMGFVSFVAKEWIARQQRSALLFTGGVGVNTATTAVEFSGGVTFSYRSIAISGLMDVGRDTKLGGGFTVGESLGPTSSAAPPITSTYWTVKPALALSVRIPVGNGK